MSCADHRIYLDLEVRRVDCRQCGAVKRERLDFLVENALHTKRFALYVGRRCRSGTIRDMAAELRLDWQTVKRLEMDYMREQIRRVGTPGPKVIGIDEISIRKGHTYRIVVSDLERRRPIWFGGDDRSEASMDQFYRFLGQKKAKRIRLAVMDMWKAFRNSTHANAPQAAILFDKFHVMKHLGEALDKVRKAEYARLGGKQRQFIKGQKYTLLSHPQNLTGTAKKNLKLLLAANKRLNTAYLQGILRSTLGLQPRGLGAQVLRELASEPEVAALEAVREVRRDDRAALGRPRRLLQAGEQSIPRLCRGTEQQDTGHATSSLRLAR